MNLFRLAFPLALAATLVACPDEETTTSASDACVVDAMAAQQNVRLQPGSTIFLPTLSTDGDCAARSWTLASAPAGSGNAVVVGTDGFVRMTLDAPGNYTFDAGAGITYTAEVASTAAPFHNLNYYPSARSLVMVGDEVWVADPLNHHIARFGAADLAGKGTVATGSWPVALGVTADGSTVVVAQRGADSVAFVDVASGRVTDAVWVGDEPSNLVVNAAGTEAYVALTTEAKVAVVDIAAREVVARVDAVADPLAMALSEDGATLFVASHRSGHPDRFPYEDDPSDEERDIAVIDVATRATTGYIMDVGTTLNALHFAGGQLWISRLRNDTEANLGSTDEPSFMHEVAALTPAAGEAEATTVIDVTRAEGSGGHAVTLHGLAACDGVAWVAAEGSDLAIGIDLSTGQESARVAVEGRPRGLMCANGAVFVHGHQGLTVTRIDAGAGTVSHTASTGSDPRPADMAAGQRYFTGAGRDYAANWSCNSCHADGLTDTLIWNAGPFSSRVVSRPFFWLEGTFPLGWAGYMSNVTNYAYTVNTNVGIRPTTDEALNLAAYLKSIMPPPAANGWTQRDGSLSPEAQAGKELFDNEAGCAACHSGPLTTNRVVFDEGITEGASDVPSLVGVYRHNVWLKYGDARTLRDAVKAAGEAFNANLDDAGLDSITRYIQELTARDFFALTQKPTGAVAPGASLELVMSYPVWDDASNTDGITVTADGNAVEVDVAVDGRYLRLTPTAALPEGATVEVDLTGLQAHDGRTVSGTSTFTWTTAAAPALTMSGDYVWTVDMPIPDITTGAFSETATVATDVAFTIGDGDADTVFDYGQDLVFSQRVVINGNTVDSGPLPIPIGPSFSDSSGFQGEMTDDDGDGIVDSGSGTVTISGPGFLEEGIAWTLGRPAAAGACDVGDTAGTPPTVTNDGGVVTIDWGSDANALGVYVLAPDTNPPLGPVPIDGTAYWVLEADDFPGGFPGPVTYGTAPDGATDASDTHSGTVGGPPLESGNCYKFAVVTNTFQIYETIVSWP